MKPWKSSPACGAARPTVTTGATTTSRARASCPPRSSSRASPSGSAASGPTNARCAAWRSGTACSRSFSTPNPPKKPSTSLAKRSSSCAAMRQSADPFDVIALGATPLAQPEESAAVVRAHAAAGATWWLESIAPMRMGKPQRSVVEHEQLRAKVLEGPPRIKRFGDEWAQSVQSPQNCSLPRYWGEDRGWG